MLDRKHKVRRIQHPCPQPTSCLRFNIVGRKLEIHQNQMMIYSFEIPCAFGCHLTFEITLYYP